MNRHLGQLRLPHTSRRRLAFRQSGQQRRQKRRRFDSFPPVRSTAARRYLRESLRFDSPPEESTIRLKRMNIVGILIVLLCLTCVVFWAVRVRALWQCWTSLAVVRGDRCFYVCGYSGNDLLGVPNPEILDRRGKVFLVNGNEVRRLEMSELRAWLFEGELRATEKLLSSSMKICVVRTDAAIQRTDLPPTQGTLPVSRLPGT